MRPRRQAAFLVLAFMLAAPWLATAEPRLEHRDRAEPRVSTVSEFLSHTWSLLQTLWAGASDCDEGARIDPLGCPQPTTDAGSRADPLG
jgi:hypothetical protein